MKPGYIFSLDQVLNPNGWTSYIWNNFYWWSLLSQVFTFFHIPIWIMEKLLIIMTFILPALGGYLLFKENRKQKSPAILFGVFLLIFSPFLYSRFIDGQINIYLSYALYPILFYFIQRVIRNTNYKNILFVWLCSLLLCLTSIHNAIFLLFIFVIFWGFHLSHIGIKRISQITIWVLLCNLIWIIPISISGSTSLDQIDNFWADHRAAFQTLSWDTNIYFNALALNGYWWEQEWRFKPNTEVNDKWKNVFFILFLVVLIWIYSRIDFKNKKISLTPFEKSLLALWVLAFILSLWNSSGWPIGYINTLLFDHFPFYAWMREPHKWVMFLIIVYAYFGILGIKYITKRLNDTWVNTYIKKSSIAFLVLLPIIYTPATLLWFWGQVSIQEYPQEWKDIKSTLSKTWNDDCDYLLENKSTKCYETLAFPWHGYIGVSFTQKIIWSWILKYFWDDVLFGDNIEIRDIYTQSNRPESKIIEKYISNTWLLREKDVDTFEGIIPLSRDLKSLGIINIIVLKESDYLFYSWILDDLVSEWLAKKEQENSMLILYKILQ